jgi:hypothetical protein
VTLGRQAGFSVHVTYYYVDTRKPGRKCVSKPQSIAHTVFQYWSTGIFLSVTYYLTHSMVYGVSWKIDTYSAGKKISLSFIERECSIQCSQKPTSLNQSTPSHNIFLRSVVILCCQLHIGFRSSVGNSGFTSVSYIIRPVFRNR